MFTSTITEPRVTYIKDIGFGGIASLRTIEEMAFLINSSLKDWGVRETAQDIVRDVRERDKLTEAKSVFKWVQSKVRYTYDPKGLETIQTPKVLLEDIANKGRAYGDCDDFTVLIGSLLRGLGHTIRIKAVSFKPSMTLSHVYLEDNINNKWIVLDGIKKDESMGWESSRVNRSITLNV